MAITIANALRCPNPAIAPRTSRVSRSSISPQPPPFFAPTKFLRMPIRDCLMVCVASASGSSHANSDQNPNPFQSPEGDENPYTVLGASPIEGFDSIKTSYIRKRKDAERRGDEAYVSKLDRAYDKIMMLQLTNRKKGLTFGSFQVSKDTKYADKQPIVPWGPRPSKSSVKDMRINMAISAVFTIWILIKRSAEWKPLQFLAFAFFYRVFEKLKEYEPQVSPVFNEYGEDEGRGLRMGKRLLRAIGLVFGSMALASLAYTGVINLIEFVNGYIPVVLYNNQELIVTTATSVLLYIVASFYR